MWYVQSVACMPIACRRMAMVLTILQVLFYETRTRKLAQDAQGIVGYCYQVSSFDSIGLVLSFNTWAAQNCPSLPLPALDPS